jgi:hypothetical protein
MVGLTEMSLCRFCPIDDLGSLKIYAAAVRSGAFFWKLLRDFVPPW